MVLEKETGEDRRGIPSPLRTSLGLVWTGGQQAGDL